MRNHKPPVISVEKLNKSFYEKRAVIDFSLELHEGEICGFLGPNGAGKTTTLRMLCGLIIPDSGSGHCLGYDIITNFSSIKKNIGYMPQKFSLYGSLSVYDNLDFVARLYGLRKRASKIKEIMSLFNLTEYQNALAKNLSGGWKQKLSLASCILHKPKLLLLDEPTGGMDSSARRDFWDELSILSEHKITTLISTHYMDEAVRCTYLVYLSQRLIAEGTMTDIIDKAKLTTWMVKGENLIELSRVLKKTEGIDQVAFFGDELHVSGKNEMHFLDSIAPFQNFHWKKITPSLEDAFISLIREHKGEKCD
jgi:ABC-2 type transport system ATP-binding protein